MNMIVGLLALLLASGVLTWLTSSPNAAPPAPKHRKKNKANVRVRDRQPHLQPNEPTGVAPGASRIMETDPSAQPPQVS